MSEDQSVERLSVSEAAEALGVTRDAIHKRISRGSIRHEKGADGRLYVFVDTSKTEPDTSTDTSTDARIEALDEMREQVRYLREQVQAEREAHAEARRLLLLALERIPPALEPPPAQAEPEEPRESPVSPGPSDAADTTTEGSGGPQTPAGRRWWEFWR